jgi:hypothetical protein
MSTVASLDDALVEVLPGDEAGCGLRIRNDGPIVETYDLEVLGEAAEWTVVEPATVSVYPGADGYAQVRFQPPRSARLAAGDVVYGVRVMPAERPDEQVVPEGVVRVLPFADTGAEITPRTSQGRRGARHEVAIDNRGNTPVRVAVGGTDPDNRLRVAAKPAALVVAAGEAAFVNVTARPRRIRWRGQPSTHPFQVVVAPDEAPPVTLDAATVQVPVIPRGAGRVLAALAALLLLAGVLWFGILKPAVRSTAEEAADKQVDKVAQQAQAADEKAQRAIEQSQPKPPPGGGAPSQAPSVGPSPGSPGQRPGTVPPGSTSLSTRLGTASGAGSTDSDQYTVPARRTLVITDVLFQNPQSDEGWLELIVNGEPRFTMALRDIRYYDYHGVSPIEAPAGTVVSLRTTCSTPGTRLPRSTGGSQCRIFTLLGGYQRPNPTRSPSPSP